MIHQPYVGEIRDAAGLVYRVAWAPTNDGAKTFLPPTVYRSNRYDPGGYPDLGEAGVIQTEGLEWSPYWQSGVPARVCGGCYIGDDDWFLTGDWPLDAPPVALDPDGFATDCQENLVAVKSVGLAADPNTFVVSGSPVTSVGTLSLDWVDVPTGYALLGPPSGQGHPFFQPLVIPKPLTPHSLWTLGFEYLSYSGAAFQIGGGIDWCCGFWFQFAPSPVSQVLWYAKDSVSGQYTQVYWSSGLIQITMSGAFGAAGDVVVPFAGDTDWHLLVFGYDSVAGVCFATIDAGARVTVAASGGSGITADEVSLAASLAAGPPYLPYSGFLEEFFVAGTIADTDIANLYNSGDGLYYLQIPCAFWHTISLYFPLWEDHADRVDLVQGYVWPAIADPLAAAAICGWRFGVPSRIFEPISFLATVGFGNVLNWTNQLSPPTPPIAGTTALYVDPSGVLVTMNSSGFVAPVAGPTPPSTWMRVEVDFTTFPGIGNTLIPLQVAPAGFCYGRAIGINTIPWVPSSPAGVVAVGVYGPNMFSDVLAEISGSGRINFAETTWEPSPNKSNGDVTNFHANTTSQLYVGITRANSLPATTQGHAIFWIEVLQAS